MSCRSWSRAQWKVGLRQLLTARCLRPGLPGSDRSRSLPLPGTVASAEQDESACGEDLMKVPESLNLDRNRGFTEDDLGCPGGRPG